MQINRCLRLIPTFISIIQHLLYKRHRAMNVRQVSCDTVHWTLHHALVWCWWSAWVAGHINKQ